MSSQSEVCIAYFVHRVLIPSASSLCTFQVAHCMYGFQQYYNRKINVMFPRMYSGETSGVKHRNKISMIRRVNIETITNENITN